MSDAAAFCAQITAEHARTFAAASRFLPPEKRRASFAVYAFCRVADDIVDERAAGNSVDVSNELLLHRAQLEDVVNGNRPDRAPVFEELGWAMRRFGIPASPFEELLYALEGDLVPVEYATWPSLARYCGGVASTVGEMCAHVFGVQSGDAADALQHARTLGVALQLTNILRDVGEDAVRGRCYLPTEDLAAFGIDRREILRATIRASDRRWRALMKYEIARARDLYASSTPGLALIDRDARCCATICARGYAAILGAIERRGYDSLTGRARIGAVRKASVMAGAWIGSLGSAELVRLSPVRGRA